MKELSIEEKAKAYDEALGKAHKLCDKLCVYPTTKPFVSDLQDLFPELKESGDERIRKVLLNDFKNNCSEYYCEGVNRDMIIAWLEKQGEQKPIDPDTLIQQRVDALADIVADQKPTDKVEPKFKVGDRVRYKGYAGDGVITKITDTDYICDNAVLPIPTQDKLELVEQNHAWSEEDEEIVEALNAYVKNLDMFFSEIKIGDKNIPSKEFCEKVQYWLKSLKDRVQLQPKQEWSEEDEKAINDIM